MERIHGICFSGPEAKKRWIEIADIFVDKVSATGRDTAWPCLIRMVEGRDIVAASGDIALGRDVLGEEGPESRGRITVAREAAA